MTAPQDLHGAFRGRRFGRWYSFVLPQYDADTTLNDYAIDADSLRVTYVEDDRLSVIFRGSKLPNEAESESGGETDERKLATK